MSPKHREMASGKCCNAVPLLPKEEEKNLDGNAWT
jgi:hypothetical protein